MRFVFAFLAVLSSPVFAHDYQVGDIKIMHPVSYPTVARSGAGYMELMNTGTDNDSLIAVKADFPKVMIHNTETVDGVNKMIHQMRVDIPTGETVTFAPGGLHVMFMGLTDKWVVGDEIAATLVFEHAGELDLVFKVEERPAMDPSHNDHANH